MVSLEEIEVGDRVRVIDIEPERFQDDPILDCILSGNIRIRGKEGIVYKVDKLNQIIQVRFNSGMIGDFDLWSLEKVT